MTDLTGMCSNTLILDSENKFIDYREVMKRVKEPNFYAKTFNMKTACVEDCHITDVFVMFYKGLMYRLNCCGNSHVALDHPMVVYEGGYKDLGSFSEDYHDFLHMRKPGFILLSQMIELYGNGICEKTHGDCHISAQRFHTYSLIKPSWNVNSETLGHSGMNAMRCNKYYEGILWNVTNDNGTVIIRGNNEKYRCRPFDIIGCERL
jgi:hypothetical protein